VDYHAGNTEVRWLNCHSGEERCLNIPTTRSGILRLVEKAVVEAASVGGKVVWIMESTTGWARVKELIGSRVEFIMANVLQTPLPPKSEAGKTILPVGSRRYLLLRGMNDDQVKELLGRASCNQ
jgi:hypothetical protein